ncbi:hypothetical protein GA0115256_14376 [Streptomyces sp. DconLS]|nr:hypothetical protein GA0115258_11636 [Streptomyces sp. LamerLS-31b]SCG01340.1 hypothetical protein GA0115256_14376 [Streptomyces sp. DconLS]
MGIAYPSWTDTDMIRDAERHTALRELRLHMPLSCAPSTRPTPTPPAWHAQPNAAGWRCTRRPDYASPKPSAAPCPAVHQADTALTATGGFIGTIEYITPEQARGADGHTASDLFSLDVTL